MPHMKPLKWLFLMFYFLFMFILNLMLIYFFYFDSSQYNKSHYLKKNWTWKW